MLIVVALIILVSIASYRNAVRKARETVLKQNLWTLRDLLDQHYADKGEYPTSLEDLVSAGYLRRIPVDPTTGQPDWVPIPFTDAEGIESVASESAGGIWDVRSSSERMALNGEYYSEW